jgi:hypothetical protein
VDSFGIKYLKKEDPDHLIESLCKYYKVKVTLDGKDFFKIELDWDYENGKVHLSMAPYLKKALLQSDNIAPSKHQDSPYPHLTQIRSKTQYAEYDQSPPVGPQEQMHFQRSNGKFLYYAAHWPPSSQNEQQIQ